MLFKEILEKKYKIISEEIQKLVDLAFLNQTHQGDLLLIFVNGFYHHEAKLWDNDTEKYSPFAIGPNREGLSEMSHYHFINYYRTTAISQLSMEEYFKQLADSSATGAKDNFVNAESMTIHMEMMIYLKIWESDSFIKRFYQIVRLINGENYDWFFRIKEANRDSKRSTGSRQQIIRKKIRDKLQTQCPILFDTFKNAYNTQTRNSIAHSKYSFLGRNIFLNNFVGGDKSAQLHRITFDKWIEQFHDTLAIYNGYFQMLALIQDIYSNMAKTRKITQVRLIEEQTINQETFHGLEYRKGWGDWKWERKI